MAERRPRIAYLTFGSGVYDARTLRMARTAIAAGYDVTMYARWEPGLPVREDLDGVAVVRAAYDWRLAVPGLRGGARRRAAAAMLAPILPPTTDGRDASRQPSRFAPLVPVALRERWRRWRRRIRIFPLYGLGWAAGLEGTAETADVWHGMWAGSLPALDRMRRRFGGRTIYDSRDVYMQSRDLARSGGPAKALLEWLERRWARRADRVITVNDDYARLLADQLRIDPPLVIMNLPDPWEGTSRPDLIRSVLHLPPETGIVLYQGGLMSGRGIEQAMNAILEVPGAVLCLLGFGELRESLVEASRTGRYAGKVFVLDPVRPDDLLEWTASADVSVMAIQPTSVNHRYTTPQKLFESIAAGVPVVAADLPGMAAVVKATAAGALVDPTDPAAIAAAIRELLAVSPSEAAERRARIVAAARERYNWTAEAPILLQLYRDLIAR